MKKSITKRALSVILSIVMAFIIVPLSEISIDAAGIEISAGDGGYIGKTYNALSDVAFSENALTLSDVFSNADVLNYEIRSMSETKCAYSLISDSSTYAYNQSKSLDASIDVGTKIKIVKLNANAKFGMSFASSSSGGQKSEYFVMEVTHIENASYMSTTASSLKKMWSTSNVVSPNFINDINALGAAEFFARYGTHIVTGYSAGGTAYASYEGNSIATNAEFSSSLNTSVGMGVDIGSFLNLKGSMNISESGGGSSSGNNTCSKLQSTSIGGNGILDLNEDGANVASVNAYVNTITANNSRILIDGNLKLLSIWDFIYASGNPSLYNAAKLLEEYYFEHIEGEKEQIGGYSNEFLNYAGCKIISTPEELNSVRNDLDGVYVLACNIDLSSYENWQPIGSRTEPFTGIFFGNSNTISGLHITSCTNDVAGLFGYNNGRIQGVRVEGNIQVDSANSVGAIAAYNNGVVTDCYDEVVYDVDYFSLSDVNLGLRKIDLETVSPQTITIGDENGIYLVGRPDKVYYGINIVIQKNEVTSPAYIILENVNIVGDSANGTIYSDNDRQIRIISTGNKNAISGADSRMAINASGAMISFFGNAEMVVQGGKGINGAAVTSESANGNNGTDGATAIKGSHVYVNMAQKLTVKGGNGGNGSSGCDGKSGGNGSPDYNPDNGSRNERVDGRHGGNGESGGNGGNGGNGGAGAVGIVSDALAVVSALEVVSGEGGKGGSGGNGGNGGRGGNGEGVWSFHHSTGGNGGNGGDGGNGGNGGIGGDSHFAVIAQTVNVTDPSLLNITNGKAGDGGSFGRRGIAGSGGSRGIGYSGAVFVGIKVSKYGSDGSSGNDGYNGIGGANGTVQSVTLTPTEGYENNSKILAGITCGYTNNSLSRLNNNSWNNNTISINSVSKINYFSGDNFDKSTVSFSVNGEEVYYDYSFNSQRIGINCVRITDGNCSRLIPVYVTETVPVRIEIAETGKSEFVKNTQFTTDGLSIKVVYNNGSETYINAASDGVSVNSPDMTLEGTKTVTVSYDYDSDPATATLVTTYTISVVRVSVTGIDVENNPNAMTYMPNDKFNPNGLKIKILRNDGSTETIDSTNADLKYIYDFSVDGIRTVTVDYHGHKAYIDCTVTAHAYGEWYTVEAADHSKEGLERRDCNYNVSGHFNCFETRVTPKIPHVFDRKVISNEYKKSDATFYSPAVYYYSCECGVKGKETFTYGEPLTNENDPQIVIDNVRGLPGEYVTVNFTLKNTDPVKSMMLYKFIYNDSVLELQTDSIGWTVDGALLSDWNASTEEAALLLNANTDINGAIFSLKFKILDDAELGNQTISCSVVAKSKPENEAEKSVEIAIVSGSIEITSIKRGDVNGDDSIDSDDVIYLLKYTLIPDYYPINQSGDMDGNGSVDSDDVIYLLKHTLLPDYYPLH